MDRKLRKHEQKGLSLGESTVPPTIKKIVLCGNYGASNLGDEAVLDGILSLIQKVFPDAEVTVMSADPAETERLHHVKSVVFIPSGLRSFAASLHENFGKTSQAIKKADLFIMGGGGLFSDEKFRALWIWTVQAFFPAFLNKPIVCIGQSVGPLKTWLGRFFAKRFFRKCKMISVRDSASAKLLKELGFTSVEALADPAFSLSVQAKDFSEREKFIVLSIRPWLPKELHDQHEVLAHFIDWVHEKYGFKTKLVPFQIFQDNDSEELKKILSYLQYPQSAELTEFSPDYQKTLELISRAQAVVGMRLHSLIFATLSETPFLALSYSQKIDGLINDLDLSDLLLSWKNLQLSELQKKFEVLMNQQKTLQEKLHEKKVMSKVLVEKNVELLKSSQEHQKALPAQAE